MEPKDQWWVAQIKAGGKKREIALEEIFCLNGLERKIWNLIKDHGANQQDLEDVKADGLIVLDNNIRTEKFKGDSSVEYYYVSICKWLWMNKRRKNTRVDLVDDPRSIPQNDFNFTPEDILLDKDRKELVKQHLHALGSTCTKVLTMWMMHYAMEEIAETMGWASEAVARKNKYKCLQKLKEIILSKKNDF